MSDHTDGTPMGHIPILLAAGSGFLHESAKGLSGLLQDLAHLGAFLAGVTAFVAFFGPKLSAFWRRMAWGDGVRMREGTRREVAKNPPEISVTGPSEINVTGPVSAAINIEPKTENVQA